MIGIYYHGFVTYLGGYMKKLACMLLNPQSLSLMALACMVMGLVLNYFAMKGHNVPDGFYFFLGGFALVVIAALVNQNLKKKKLK